MNATEQWQDLIADNLSTANVPGSRQREAVFSAVPVGVSGLGHDPYVIPSAGSSISFKQGELLATGNSMDFAVEGPGFLSVQMPDGSKAYTRDGQFKLNAGYGEWGAAVPLGVKHVTGARLVDGHGVIVATATFA